MPIRVNCPTCKAVNNIDEEKRGRKVRCRKCEKPISVPDEDEDAIQEEPKLKVKSASVRNKQDEDDEDRPAKKKKKEPAKKSSSLFLILGGVAAALLFCLVGVGGAGGWYFFIRQKPTEPDTKVVAKGDPPKEDVKKVEDPTKEPEKSKEPEKKKDPEKTKEPDPKTIGPKPLSAELQKVKQATVLVTAWMPGGKKIEGTGFFAGGDGLIITSAFAAGMLDPNYQSIKMEVTINPGEPDAIKKGAVILSIDRDNDLAALRVKTTTYPASLTLEEPSKIATAQKVHVAGYKGITATEIAKLKKALNGMLEEIHVNAGVNKSNSGAAVVSVAGNVVGVALGSHKDPQVQQAIPADFVKRFLDGKVGELTFGKTRPLADKTVILVEVPLLDPLKKIKQVRLEVWTGNPTPGRPYSYQQPVPLPGDSERQTQPMTVKDSVASNEIPVPASIPTGKVVWVQPVIVLADQSTQWGVATVMPLPTSPYDKLPAILNANVVTPKERTVKLTATHVYNFSTKSDKKPVTHVSDLNILEVMGPDANGAIIRTGYGALKATSDRDGQATPAAKPILDLVYLIPNTYNIDATNKWTKRTLRLLGPEVPKETREPALDEQFHISTAVEAMMVPLPNKTVQPAESWQSTSSFFLRSKGDAGEMFLVLTSTYEGLTKGKKVEAVITVTGKIQARDAKYKDFEGDVAGKLGFDQTNGMISSGQLKLSSPASADKDSYTLDIDFTRVPGNDTKIKLPMDPKTKPDPDPIAKKIILNEKGNVTNKDPVDQALSNPKLKKNAHYKLVPNVMLEQGKKYAIQLDSAAFDAVLKLWSPNNMLLQADDNSGGGTNARIVFIAPATGAYHIWAIAHPGKTGAFHLTVTLNP